LLNQFLDRGMHLPQRVWLLEKWVVRMNRRRQEHDAFGMGREARDRGGG
jgi:hypothetical protein